MIFALTGASGFIGHHLTRHLLAAGHQVHALLRPTSDRGRLESLGAGEALRFWDVEREDLADSLSVIGADAVFHLAAYAPRGSETPSPARIIESNIAFGVRLAEAMLRAGPRRLINTASYSQFDRDGNYRPNGFYAASKQAFQDLLGYYEAVRGFDVVNLVLYDTYGPGDWRAKLINELFGAARNGTPLAMTEGHQKIDLIHVDDVVAAFKAAATDLIGRNGNFSGARTVGTGRLVSLREAVDIFRDVTGFDVEIAWGERPYPDGQIFDPMPAQRPPGGWTSRISLEDGLRDMASRPDGVR